jgi:hypothetical protein
MSKKFDFGELVDFSNWKDFDSFMQDFDKRLDKDIKKSLEIRRKLRKKLLANPKIKQAIRPREQDIEKWKSLLDWAGKELFGGNVCGVDGTLSHYPMASGTRCRIGIVTTSYKNDRIEKVLYVSERQLVEKSKTPMEHFNKLLQGHRISNLLVRAIMLYGERQLALKRQEKWKFVHGELLPYELRTGLGAYKALDVSLELGKRLIEEKTVIGVIEDTRRLDLLNAGDILTRGQYMPATDLKRELQIYLDGDEEKGLSGAHFNPKDRETFQKFIDDYAENIKIGIFRVGYKPFLFQAHKDVFDEAAALFIKDSFNQPMRGFPLLIDYADAVCSKVLSAGDFRTQITSRIAKISPDALGFEMMARSTRRR